MSYSMIANAVLNFGDTYYVLSCWISNKFFLVDKVPDSGGLYQLKGFVLRQLAPGNTINDVFALHIFV